MVHVTATSRLGWARACILPSTRGRAGDAMLDAPIDQTVLDALRDIRVPGTPDVLTELIDLFLEETPPKLEQVHDAVARRDAEELRRSAHALRSAAASLGVREVRALSVELELLGKQDALGDAAELVGRLTEAYGRAVTALRAERSPE